jgi:asparagine synthase (glutamine-hydrolysing)
VLTRRKVGFRVPFNEWFRGPLRAWLSDHLEGAGALSRPFYRHGAVERLISEHAAGAQNHERLLWTMLSLELFQREYRLTA